MCSSPFWGDVGIKKWSRFFCFGPRSAIFCHMKTGTVVEPAISKGAKWWNDLTTSNKLCSPSTGSEGIDSIIWIILWIQLYSPSKGSQGIDSLIWIILCFALQAKTLREWGHWFSNALPAPPAPTRQALIGPMPLPIFSSVYRALSGLQTIATNSRSFSYIAYVIPCHIEVSYPSLFTYSVRWFGTSTFAP